MKTELLDIRNCDCMELMQEYEDKHFDLAIVDPPYGIGEDGAKNHSRDKCAVATKYIPKEWDKKTPDRSYFKELKRVSKNQIIWGGNYFSEHLLGSMGWIFWDKQMSGDFSDGELAYTSFDRALRKFTFAWNGMIQGDMKNKESRIHPTQKPVKLYDWLLTNYAEKGQKILDTHLGSGSSAIACHYAECPLVACELDADYYENACKRIKKETAQMTLL
ncbi:MAG: site-specific DNA-methyltransferase [bacterium]|nr:site-specific DNA-methyltransferase [bacterium]